MAPRRLVRNYVGIRGLDPSECPALVGWLMGQRIASVSLNPDTVVDTLLRQAEKKAG